MIWNRTIWLSKILTLIALLLTLGLASAQQSEITTGAVEIRGRLGPGYDYPRVEILPPESPITPLGLSPDEDWVQVQYFTLRLWIERPQLELPEDVTLPTVTEFPPAPELPYEQCISLVGDSVPNGKVIYMVPGHGFGVLQTIPLSVILEDALEQAGLSYLEVRDRTVSATYLSNAGKNPYRDTETYQALLEDNCRFTIITPWINDLSVELENPALSYVTNMTEFLDTLRQNNPRGEILVLGYYYGFRSDFAELSAPGYTDENIVLFNAMTFATCSSIWQDVNPITCVGTENIFRDLEEHVVLSHTREEVEISLYEPIPADVAPFFTTYWREHPTDEVVGDGVHLNEAGKQRLAEVLVQTMLRIEPKL